MEIRLRSRKLAGGLGLLLALGLIAALAVPALAIPPQPHQFWGSVTIGETLAPEGTIVSAQIDGVEYESGTVDADGNYGYDPLFKVPADDPGTPDKEGGAPGETVEFYITNATLGLDEVKANETAEFEIWGQTNLDLTVPADIPPTVVSTSPVNGATDVPVDTVVTATFSEPVDETTIVFTLDTVSGTVTYADTTATFTPGANLDYGTTYTASIQASDLAGNPMPEAYTWSFTTTGEDTTPPEVVSTSPVNSAGDVAVDTVVTATFNEPIDEATIVFTLDAVSGTVGYGDTTATFTPDANLDYSTTCTASIQASDLAGNPMAEAYTWSFTTRGPPGTLGLVAGVNVIAYTGATADLPGALTNIGPDGLDVVDIIWARGAWTGGVWLYYEPEIVLNTLSQLEAGRAYIMVVTEDCTWELP